MSLNQGSYNSSCTTLRIWLRIHKAGAFWLGESNIYRGSIALPGVEHTPVSWLTLANIYMSRLPEKRGGYPYAPPLNRGREEPREGKNG